MLRGLTRCCLGDRNWQDDIDHAVELGRSTAAWTQVVVLAYPYVVHLATGALLPDEAAMRRTAEALQIAEQSGDNFTLANGHTGVRNDDDAGDTTPMKPRITSC